jgi:hypothetical protein
VIPIQVFLNDVLTFSKQACHADRRMLHPRPAFLDTTVISDKEDNLPQLRGRADEVLQEGHDAHLDGHFETLVHLAPERAVLIAAFQHIPHRKDDRLELLDKMFCRFVAERKDIKSLKIQASACVASIAEAIDEETAPLPARMKVDFLEVKAPFAHADREALPARDLVSFLGCSNWFCIRYEDIYSLQASLERSKSWAVAPR